MNCLQGRYSSQPLRRWYRWPWETRPRAREGYAFVINVFELPSSCVVVLGSYLPPAQRRSNNDYFDQHNDEEDDDWGNLNKKNQSSNSNCKSLWHLSSRVNHIANLTTPNSIQQLCITCASHFALRLSSAQAAVSALRRPLGQLWHPRRGTEPREQEQQHAR